MDARAILRAVSGDPAARRADVDWLRVGGMLLVFLIHAAEPFNPWDTWHIAYPERSKILGAAVLFLAPWIMPLFMMLAGQSAWYALAKRSAAAYARERLLRIGLPLVAGILLLVPPQVWLERLLQGRFRGSLLDFYPHFFDGFYPAGNLSWHHLWFLVFLLGFALVTLPLFEWLRTPRGRRAMARLAAPGEGLAGLAWLVFPAIALRVGLQLLFHRFDPIAYDWSNRILLLPAFVFGFMVEGEPAFQRAAARAWRSALALALLTSAALIAWAWPGHVLARLPPPRSAGGVLLSTAYACAAGFWLVALLGGARRHLGRRVEGLDRASELVYPFYVLHHPVIVAAAFVAVGSGAGIVPAFVFVAAGSLAATIALCWIVDSSGTLRVLFGLRRRRAPRQAPGGA